MLIAQEARALLQYNLRTGRLTRIATGEFADGHINAQGYRTVSLQGKRYLAHRLVWLICTGEWPEKGKVVDHRDIDPANNRFGNLRVVTHGVNLRNLKGPKKRPSNSDLPLGVTPHGVNFRAQIKINRKHFNLGSYSTPEEASQVYAQASADAEKGVQPASTRLRNRPTGATGEKYITKKRNGFEVRHPLKARKAFTSLDLAKQYRDTP